MNERRCPACGADQQPGANFCAQCGVASDAEYVDLGQDDTIEVLDVGRPRLTKVLVPVGVFALVGLLVVALLGAGGSNEPDPTAEAERPTVALVATVPPAPTIEATSAPTATPPPTPTPTTVALNTPVDPAILPATDATHLAIAYRSTVHFLDLQSGAWSRTEVGREISVEGGGLPFDRNAANAFGAGVLVQTGSGEAISVPISGEVVGLSTSVSSGVLAVRNNVAFLQDFADENRNITTMSPAGEVLYQIPLDAGIWARGVTTEGLVVVQAGSVVVLVGAEGSSSLGNGILHGVVGNKVLLYDCVTVTECGIELVDAVTGERSATTAKGNYFESISSDRIVSYGTRGEVTVYRLVGDELIEIPDAPDPNSRPDLGVATDSIGLSARVVIDQIEFFDDTETVLASIPFEVDQCCVGPFGVAFVYAE